MLTMYPDHVCAQTHSNEILESIDFGLRHRSMYIVAGAVSILSVFYERISEFKPNPGETYVKKEDVRNKYEPILQSKMEQLTTKNEKKILQPRIKDALALLDGRATPNLVVINQQNIRIEGAGNKLIFETVQNLAQKFTYVQISENERLQEILGIKILPKKVAVTLKKIYRDELDRSREQSKKERSQNRAAKRKQKEEKGRYD